MLPAALLACAISVSPVTLNAVIHVESGGNTQARHVNINGSTDYGLMQINGRNVERFGLTVQQIMDPCTNIRVGGLILAANYAEASKIWHDPQEALRRALAAYNTGSFYKGASYVARYYGKWSDVQISIPEIRTASLPPSPYVADTEVWWADYHESAD